jgi:peptidoglycan/LPS O-acetylase OafA/YrhL
MHAADRGSPAHLDALTGIRGIAAWLVVLYHIRDALISVLPATVIAVLAKGYLAVDLFFILSGFVLWYNYAARLREGGSDSGRWGAAGHFLWRRIARIWPLHLVILGLFVAFAPAIVAAGRDAAFYPLGELPLHVLLIQNWGFTPALTWNDPAWSISTEMAAYLAFPLVVAAAKWERLPIAALLALALALVSAIPLYFWADDDTILGADISRLGLVRCLLEFSLGNVLCLLWLRWRGTAHGAKIAFAICAAVLGAGIGLALPETTFVPACFAAGLLALALGQGAIVCALGGRVLRYLGEVSYSTYLAHTFLFLAFKLILGQAAPQIGWLGLAGFLGLVLAASIALYHGVEKPAQRWMNRHTPRWPWRESAVPAE